MRRTIRVSQALTQNHIAPAFPENTAAAPGSIAQTGQEMLIAGQLTRMKLRIAAGQIYRIRISGRGFIRQGAERQDVGPSPSPGCQQMGVAEGKSSVLRDGNALTQGR